MTFTMLLLHLFGLGKLLMRTAMGRTLFPMMHSTFERHLVQEVRVVLVLGEVFAKEEWKNDKPNIDLPLHLRN